MRLHQIILPFTILNSKYHIIIIYIFCHFHHSQKRQMSRMMHHNISISDNLVLHLCNQYDKGGSKNKPEKQVLVQMLYQLQCIHAETKRAGETCDIMCLYSHETRLLSLVLKQFTLNILQKTSPATHFRSRSSYTS